MMFLYVERDSGAAGAGVVMPPKGATQTVANASECQKGARSCGMASDVSNVIVAEVMVDRTKQRDTWGIPQGKYT